MPNKTGRFHLYSDTSKYATGSALYQIQGGKPKLITITLVIYLFCKHKHIRTIVASLLLYKEKEVEASKLMKIENSECGTLAYIGIALTLLSMAVVILLHYRKSKFCRGHRFSNVVK